MKAARLRRERPDPRRRAACKAADGALRKRMQAIEEVEFPSSAELSTQDAWQMAGSLRDIELSILKTSLGHIQDLTGALQRSDDQVEVCGRC